MGLDVLEESGEARFRPTRGSERCDNRRDFHPAGRRSSSVAPVDDAHDETRPLDGLAKTYFEPTAGFRRDDWWQVELEESTSGRVVIVTGDEAGGRILKSGYVELSGNGKTWRRGGGFSKNNGRAEFKATSPFRFLRVRSNQDYKAPFVIRHVQIFKVQ